MTNATQQEDNLMINRSTASSEAKFVFFVAFGHDPMTIKPIVKEQKITNMCIRDFAKANQDVIKVNHAPQNTHMYPQREKQ